MVCGLGFRDSSVGLRVAIIMVAILLATLVKKMNAKICRVVSRTS